MSRSEEERIVKALGKDPLLKEDWTETYRKAVANYEKNECTASFHVTEHIVHDN